MFDLDLKQNYKFVTICFYLTFLTYKKIIRINRVVVIKFTKHSICRHLIFAFCSITMDRNTLLPFISPTTICIVGPTQAGKSMFTKRLLENSKEIVTCPPVKILYAYSEYQQLFDEMQDISNLAFHEGLLDKQKLEEFSPDSKHTLLVFDDLVSKIVQSEELLHLFTVT